MNHDQHTVKVNADMPWRIWVTPEEAKGMLTLEYGLAQATYLHEDFHDAGMRMLQDRITRLLKAGQGLVSRMVYVPTFPEDRAAIEAWKDAAAIPYEFGDGCPACATRLKAEGGKP